MHLVGDQTIHVPSLPITTIRERMMKQHHSQAVFVLVCACFSANLLLNFVQQKLMKEELPTDSSRALVKTRTPKLVWLMSFPNSGTSYTLRTLEHLSNYSMGTNYGSEGERTQLIYEDLPQGPRCRGPSDKWTRPLPPEFVLIKTHCTGYATNEGASALKRDRKEFIEGCATTRPNIPNIERGTYDPTLVHKAIHVIRNPFHNLISRFNCEHKIKEDSFADKYPKDAHGFHKFCQDLDADFDHQYSKELFPMNQWRHDVKHTRCHDDIISYVMWHNHAFETCRELHIPTMVVHYEDYEDDFNMTFANMLDFLHLEEKGSAPGFAARHDYQDYFTNEDLQSMKDLVKHLASNHTWKAIAHYFDD